MEERIVSVPCLYELGAVAMVMVRNSQGEGALLRPSLCCPGIQEQAKSHLTAPDSLRPDLEQMVEIYVSHSHRPFFVSITSHSSTPHCGLKHSTE